MLPAGFWKSLESRSREVRTERGAPMIRVGIATGSDEGINHHAKKPCTHSRLIDDVLDTKGDKTGRLLCLECNATFPDPTFLKPVH